MSHFYFLSIGLNMSNNVDSGYSVLLAFVITIVAGVLAGRAVEKIKLPAITGYVLAGIIIGPHVLGIVNTETLHALEIFTTIALGFIAFNIGAELYIPKVKKSGKEVVIIVLFQAIITYITVFIAYVLFGQPLWFALILASIAVATAPAPILVIVKKYHAKGPVTNTLLPLVGIDDAIGILFFSISLSVGIGLAAGGEIHIAHAVFEGLTEIFLSIAFGSLLGVLLVLITKRNLKSHQTDFDEQQFYLTVAVVLLCVIFANMFHLSMILTPMAVGFVFTNLVKKDTYLKQEHIINNFLPLLLVAFFTIAGETINLTLLSSAGIIAVIYIAARTFGKLFGTYLGAVVAKSSDNVKRYMGLSLLSQGGVEIGLVFAATAALDKINPDYGVLIQTVVFTAILFFELVGPPLVKQGLCKSGEACDL